MVGAGAAPSRITCAADFILNSGAELPLHNITETSQMYSNTPTTVKPEEKTSPNLQKVDFHCAWHVQYMFMVFV